MFVYLSAEMPGYKMSKQILYSTCKCNVLLFIYWVMQVITINFIYPD